MASDQSFVDFVVDQLKDAGTITAKKMFGEYGLYCNGKFFGVICDNRLFVKPTEPGREYIDDVVEAPAYPGAKPSFLIEDKVDNRPWLCELIRITVKALPKPKPKKEKIVQSDIAKVDLLSPQRALIMRILSSIIPIVIAGFFLALAAGCSSEKTVRLTTAKYCWAMNNHPPRDGFISSWTGQKYYFDQNENGIAESSELFVESKPRTLLQAIPKRPFQ